MTLGNRNIDLREGIICKDCLIQFPNFIAGAIHLAYNIPKEAFARRFLYPPFNLTLEEPEIKERKPRKRTVKVVEVETTQDIVVVPEDTRSSVEKNIIQPDENNLASESKPKRRRSRKTMDDKVEEYLEAKKEFKRVSRKKDVNK